jgi:uncharacterized membrane protein
VDFNTTKNLGGIGALLMFIGFIIPYISFFGGVISTVGLILILAALYGFADLYKEHGILNNAILGIIVTVIGVVLVVVVAISLLYSPFVSFLQLIFPGWSGPPNWSALSGMTPNTSNITAENLIPIISAEFVGLAVAWLIVWVFSFEMTYLVRKSLKLLSAKSGSSLISTVALIMLIGGALTVVFIGFLLIWVALLLLAIAFFNMKQTVPSTSAPPTAPAPSMV